MQHAEVPWLIWASFLSLTALHVYANIKAVRALTLTSLNPSRMQLIVDTFYHKVCLIRELLGRKICSVSAFAQTGCAELVEIIVTNAQACVPFPGESMQSIDSV